MPHLQDDTTTGLPSDASRVGGGDPVELQALADRVYRLLVAEVRLERARGANAPTRR
jgi:hypothetical protein